MRHRDAITSSILLNQANGTTRRFGINEDGTFHVPPDVAALLVHNGAFELLYT